MRGGGAPGHIGTIQSFESVQFSLLPYEPAGSSLERLSKMRSNDEFPSFAFLWCDPRFPRSTGTRLREFPSVTDPIGSFPSIRSGPPYPPFIPGPDCTFQPANLGLPRGRIDLELANAARMKGTDDAAGKASNRERAFSGNTGNQTPFVETS